MPAPAVLALVMLIGLSALGVVLAYIGTKER